MVKDAQVKGLFKALSSVKGLYAPVLRADMSDKAARRCLQAGRLPSEVDREYGVGAGFPKKQESPGLKLMTVLRPPDCAGIAAQHPP